VKTKQIFLDLDDVLNCCTMSALKYVGCPVDEFDNSAFQPEWGFDIIHAANCLHQFRTFTISAFWESIKRDFWASIPKSPECDLLIEGCASIVGMENICILTAPTLDPDCLAGKLEWIHSFMPKELHRRYLIGPAKHCCAKPGSLLIDDSDRNIQRFRESGGMAITVPRPWNRMHRWSDGSLRHVLFSLGIFTGEPSPCECT